MQKTAEQRAESRETAEQSREQSREQRNNECESDECVWSERTTTAVAAA